MDVGGPIRERGWRQGSLLEAAAATHAGVNPGSLDGAQDLVLISHSCDVVHHDLDKEPFAEFIPRVRVDAVDGNLTFAKSPRVLQVAGGTGAYELTMARRITIPRDALAGIDPSGQLSDDECVVLRRWLASRYARAAFADEFNQRLRPAQNSISRRLKADGERLSGLYLAVDGSELPPEVTYEISIVGTMREADHEHAEDRLKCQHALNDVMGAIQDRCPGISVLDAVLVSESDVTLADLRVLSRWDYDSLSLRNEPPEAPPADEDA